MKKNYTLLAMFMLGAMTIAAQTTVVFQENFDDCGGTGGTDGAWSGTVASANFPQTLIDAGWTSAGQKWYSGAGCAKFGIGSAAGDVTTPEITVTGEAVLTFDAGAWVSASEGTTLNVNIGTTSQQVTLTKGAFSTFTVNFTGTGATKITFQADKVTNNRFFLDNVKVITGTETGIENVNVAPTIVTNAVYSISGSYLGTDVNALPKGVYIVNGKKVVKQ